MNIHGVTQVQNDFANGGYYKALSFHDITSGSNGDYVAGTGWDAVTGMGSFAKYTPVNRTTTTIPFYVYIIIAISLLFIISCLAVICILIIRKCKRNISKNNLISNNSFKPQLQLQPTVTTTHDFNDSQNFSPINTNLKMTMMDKKEINDVDNEVENYTRPIDPFFATYFFDDKSNANINKRNNNNENHLPQPQLTSSITETMTPTTTKAPTTTTPTTTTPTTTSREANITSSSINTKISGDDASFPPLMPFVKSFNVIKEEKQMEEREVDTYKNINKNFIIKINVKPKP